MEYLSTYVSLRKKIFLKLGSWHALIENFRFTFIVLRQRKQDGQNNYAQFLNYKLDLIIRSFKKSFFGHGN